MMTTVALVFAALLSILGTESIAAAGELKSQDYSRNHSAFKKALKPPAKEGGPNLQQRIATVKTFAATLDGRVFKEMLVARAIEDCGQETAGNACEPRLDRPSNRPSFKGTTPAFFALLDVHLQQLVGELFPNPWILDPASRPAVGKLLDTFVLGIPGRGRSA